MSGRFRIIAALCSRVRSSWSLRISGACRVIPVENILFASEMVGAVRGIDPETGHHFDDTRRYIDALPLSAEDKAKIFECNAYNVYGRLKSQIAKQAA